MASRALGWLVLVAARLVAWSYYLLPDFCQRLAAGIVGGVLRLARWRAEVVRQNLEIAFSGSDPQAVEQRERIFRNFYRSFGHLVFEILMVLGPMKKFVTHSAEFRGIRHWQEAKAKGRGVIFLASHVGNWEVMAASGAHSGFDVLIVTKHLKPEWLHLAFEAGRRHCGVAGTYEPRTFRDVLKHLKSNGTVGIVLDQYAGPPVGVRVPFLGVPVGTQSAVAILAKRTGAVVLPVTSSRCEDGRFVCEVRPAVEWIPDESAEREIAINTARYAQLLERDVLANPEQWLWSHRRFKGDMGPLRPDEWTAGRTRR